MANQKLVVLVLAILATGIGLSEATLGLRGKNSPTTVVNNNMFCGGGGVVCPGNHGGGHVKAAHHGEYQANHRHYGGHGGDFHRSGNVGAEHALGMGGAVSAVGGSAAAASAAVGGGAAAAVVGGASAVALGSGMHQHGNPRVSHGAHGPSYHPRHGYKQELDGRYHGSIGHELYNGYDSYEQESHKFGYGIDHERHGNHGDYYRVGHVPHPTMHVNHLEKHAGLHDYNHRVGAGHGYGHDSGFHKYGGHGGHGSYGGHNGRELLSKYARYIPVLSRRH